MTFATASREVVRRTWVLVVAAVILGAGAYLIASRHHASWSASAVVGHAPVKVKPAPNHLKRLTEPPTSAALVISSDYLRPPAGITVSPNSGSTVAVVGVGPTASAVDQAVSAYLGRLKQHWDTEFAHAQARALASIQRHASSKHITSAQIASAAAAVKAATPSASFSTVTVKQTSNPVHALPAALLGAVSGLLLGLLIVLGVYALRGQIWSEDELAPLGVAVVRIDSRDPDAVHRLRIELEARGLGRERRSVLIASASSADRWTQVGRALAESLDTTGVQTVLIGANRAHLQPGRGVAEFLADAPGGLNIRRVGDRIGYVSAGSVKPAPMTLTADGVTALLAEAAQHGQATVIDGPPLDTPLGSLLLAAADICLLTAHRKYSTAGALTSAVAQIRRLTSRDPLLCFDVAKADRTPARENRSGGYDAMGAEQQPEEVPANANR